VATADGLDREMNGKATDPIALRGRQARRMPSFRRTSGTQRSETESLLRQLGAMRSHARDADRWSLLPRPDGSDDADCLQEPASPFVGIAECRRARERRLDGTYILPTGERNLADLDRSVHRVQRSDVRRPHARMETTTIFHQVGRREPCSDSGVCVRGVR